MLRPISAVFPMAYLPINPILEVMDGGHHLPSGGIDSYCSIQGISGPGGGGVSPRWRFEAAASTDIGLVRLENQDDFSSIPGRGLFAVADGMGGHRGGATASRIAIDGVEDFMIHDPAQTPVECLEGVRTVIRLCSAQIFHRGLHDKDLYGMGTTLSLLQLDEVGGRYYVGHVGDSRIYRIRKAGIEQLTEDHTILNAWLRLGKPVDRWKNLPTHVITRAVGLDEEVEVDLKTEALEDGDLFLLCSDGLTGRLTDDAILHLIRSHEQDLEEACRELIQWANQKGGHDNITVVLVRAKKA